MSGTARSTGTTGYEGFTGRGEITGKVTARRVITCHRKITCQMEISRPVDHHKNRALIVLTLTLILFTIILLTLNGLRYLDTHLHIFVLSNPCVSLHSYVKGPGRGNRWQLCLKRMDVAIEVPAKVDRTDGRGSIRITPNKTNCVKFTENFGCT